MIDIRATTTCSLGGELIGASISDDYVQNNGLIKTQGSCEIAGILTPAVGTLVTFSYTKDNTTTDIPRKLRVLSSFADPFRKTTKVELGCKLTYLQDLTEAIDWTAFDDDANDQYNQADAAIVTLPISASSIMNKCLLELGLTASSNPLTNSFSIEKFDLSRGYVNTLSDLLVSEGYCGYINTDEILQIISLEQNGGTGPVLDETKIIDIGSVGIGELPGEAVTVSYSTLKLKQPDTTEDNIKKLNWEKDESYGLPTNVYVENPFYSSNPFPFSVPRSFVYRYTPYTLTETTYDSFDRVKTRVTTERSILAAIAPAYLQHIAGTSPVSGPASGSFYYVTTRTESFKYKITAPPTWDTRNEYPIGYDEIEESVTESREPCIKMHASTNIYSRAGAFNFFFNYRNSAADMFVAEKTVTTYENGIANDGTKITKTIQAQYQCSAYTIEGQQQLAEAIDRNANSEEFFNAEAPPLLEAARRLSSLGCQVQLTKGREIDLQTRPNTADRINASTTNGGDPNNGWRTESTSELELAIGSATAQRRIELSLPYAPDDVFSGPSGGPFTSVASDAPAKARRFGLTQNRLLLGNRNGMNVQTAPENLPTAPFAPLFIQANNLSALYRLNGMNWTINNEGIIVGTDALFWGAVGGTGDFWFSVAPGITTLPDIPEVIDGQSTVENVVPVWNEKLLLLGRTKTAINLVSLPYALQVVTPLSIETRTKLSTELLLQQAPNALLATYTQSSTYYENTPATFAKMANNDFNETTETGTDSSSFEWIKMDLGSVYTIGKVVIGTDFNSVLPGEWSPTYTENCDVKGSIDDITYTTLFNTGTFEQGIQQYPVDATVRYIRIETIDSYLSVTEFYATEPQPATIYIKNKSISVETNTASVLVDTIVPVDVSAIEVQASQPTIAIIPVTSIVTPVASISIDQLTPNIATGYAASVTAIDLSIASAVPSVATGTSVASPVASIAMQATIPTSVGAKDPNFSSVSLLLHCNGSNGSTTFTDSSSNAFSATVTGSAAISTAQSKFGGASALFNASSARISFTSAAFQLGTGDFTIEAFIYPTSLSNTSYPTFIGTRYGAAGDSAAWSLTVNSSGSFYMYSNSMLVQSSSGVITINNWYHCAVSRQGSTLRAFVNGALVATNSSFSSNFNGTSKLVIGNDDAGTDPFQGYIDEVRVTKGVSRYNGAFTALTAPFLDS
jgi:hypothetical protein